MRTLCRPPSLRTLGGADSSTFKNRSECRAYGGSALLVDNDNVLPVPVAKSYLWPRVPSARQAPPSLRTLWACLSPTCSCDVAVPMAAARSLLGGNFLPCLSLYDIPCCTRRGLAFRYTRPALVQLTDNPARPREAQRSRSCACAGAASHLPGGELLPRRGHPHGLPRRHHLHRRSHAPHRLLLTSRSI